MLMDGWVGLRTIGHEQRVLSEEDVHAVWRFILSGYCLHGPSLPLTVPHFVSNHEQSFILFIFYKILKSSVSESCFCIFSNQKARCNTNTLLHDYECNKDEASMILVSVTSEDIQILYMWTHTHTHTYLTVGWSSSGLSLS